MRSLRFTRVILCRVNCLVVPTPELPGTAALEPDPCKAQQQLHQSMPENIPKLFVHSQEAVCYQIRDSLPNSESLTTAKQSEVCSGFQYRQKSLKALPGFLGRC